MVRISKFSKVIGYKINIKKKSVSFLYNNKLSKKEMKKTISKSIKTNKILKIKFNQEMKDWQYMKTTQNIYDKMKDDTNKWKDICVNGPEKLILLKCIYFPKQSTDQMQSF